MPGQAKDPRYFFLAEFRTIINSFFDSKSHFMSNLSKLIEKGILVYSSRMKNGLIV